MFMETTQPTLSERQSQQPFDRFVKLGLIERNTLDKLSHTYSSQRQGLNSSLTLIGGPSVNGEYRHWLQPVALTG